MKNIFSSHFETDVGETKSILHLYGRVGARTLFLLGFFVFRQFALDHLNMVLLELLDRYVLNYLCGRLIAQVVLDTAFTFELVEHFLTNLRSLVLELLCCVLKHDLLALGVYVKILPILRRQRRRVHIHKLLDWRQTQPVFWWLYWSHWRFR